MLVLFEILLILTAARLKSITSTLGALTKYWIRGSKIIVITKAPITPKSTILLLLRNIYYKYSFKKRIKMFLNFYYRIAL